MKSMIHGLGKLSSNRRGTSLIEVMVALCVIVVSFMGYMTARKDSVQFQAMDISQWRSQLVAESVGNLVTTLKSDALVGKMGGSKSYEFKANFLENGGIEGTSWLRSWLIPGLVEKVSVTVTFVDLTQNNDANGQANGQANRSVPPLTPEDLAMMNRRVETRIAFSEPTQPKTDKSNPGGVGITPPPVKPAPSEKLVWTKFILRN